MLLHSEPKTKKSKATKAKILDTAKQVFANKGFHKSTVKDITKAANLGYGTFYLYFKDKKEVFYALVEQVEGEIYTAHEDGADIEQDYPRGRSSYRALRKDLKAILESFRSNYTVLRFSNELALIDEAFARKYESIKDKLHERTKQILEKSGLVSVNLDVAATGISGMIEAAATKWAKISHENNDENIDAILPTLTKLYFKAVS